jgi:hypothetical protein
MLIKDKDQDSLALEHLNDNQTYRSVNKDEFQKIYEKIDKNLRDLHDKGQIPSKFTKI